MKPFTNKHSIAAGSPLHVGGSKKETGDGDTVLSDRNNDGNIVSRGLDRARAVIDNQGRSTPRSNNQLFDYDGDGDTMFNDSNNDGTMLSRGLRSVRNYLDPSAKNAYGDRNSSNQMFDF